MRNASSEVLVEWLDALRAKLRPDPKQLEAIAGESPILQHWSRLFHGADYGQFRHEAARHIAKLNSYR
jgi:hypothetical protein